MTSERTVLYEVDGSLEDAMKSAMTVAAETHRELMPVRLFHQGKRQMVSGVMPVRVALRVLMHNAAEKGMTADQVLDKTNRPFMKDHAEGFAKYLENALTRAENFIIPPLTLNSTGELQIYVPKGTGIAGPGYAVLPDETAIFVTDGLHRYHGLQDAVRKLRGTGFDETLLNTGIPFMMTIESEDQQVHQDFADAGKTKALPPSLLAVYDVRQPANGAVMEIAERVGLFKGRINATATSIGASSPHVFLVNQIRQFVRHSLTGSTGTSESAFSQEAENAMTNRESRERWISSRVAFLNVMTEIVPDWSEVAKLSPPGGADAAAVAQRTKEIKQRLNVPLNGAFLTTLGLVSHEVLRDVTASPFEEAQLMEQLREQLSPFNDLDWTRKEKNIWDGNIVTGGKIRTQGSAVKAAADAMLRLLGINKAPEEESTDPEPTVSVDEASIAVVDGQHRYVGLQEVFTSPGS